MKLPLVLGAALLAASAATAHDGAHPSRSIQGPADGYAYRLAAPGTYALPPIKPAADARLLDEQDSPVRLAELFQSHITLLAFLYTRCADVCPVAALRMADLQMLAGDAPAVAERLQLISLSFDPEYDTPAQMAAFGAMVRVPDVARPEWLFLTAPDSAAIEPVLADYGQPVAAKPDPDDPAGPYSHLLRVFLIDGAGVIRNIYSPDFLDPRLVLNDVLTLLAETAPDRAPPSH